MIANVRVYDVFDVLLTTNIYELLERDNPDLCRAARRDYAAVCAEVDERDRFYRSKGELKTVPLPRIVDGLERTLKAGYKIGAYSNGTRDSIRTFLREGSLEQIFDNERIVSVDDVGPKDQPASYEHLKVHFRSSGLAVVSFADDVWRYCEAAYTANIEQVYFVTPKPSDITAEVTMSNIMDIRSIADIDR